MRHKRRSSLRRRIEKRNSRYPSMFYQKSRDIAVYIFTIIILYPAYEYGIPAAYHIAITQSPDINSSAAILQTITNKICV